MQAPLEQLMTDSQAEPARASQALGDLAALLERHALNRYEDPAGAEQLVHRPDLAALRLEPAEMTALKHFLFFMLMNYPDRAAAVAHCLKKCYDPALATGLCQAIAVYWQQDDDATVALTDAITYSQGYDQFSDTVLSWFKKLATEGLPETRRNMTQKFAYYRKFYDAQL
ncbi:hypothetical protein HF324_17190 [Chitinophaga oryzae]|uniref:Uncharacterized protein n=1 Tax=Chitinophaga oryzae TaxID=2725414 RepID=A0AAE6ZHF5_9BACT|nr:hypothetical protein [Chitinophaga oryzae]QJB33025.1 hypothetical protein HF329_17560 [Chitinophaga oryzae]QJB39499.1 hypothetical protein HF324_17190 [Chitinophaga oryzae]